MNLYLISVKHCSTYNALKFEQPCKVRVLRVLLKTIFSIKSIKSCLFSCSKNFIYVSPFGFLLYTTSGSILKIYSIAGRLPDFSVENHSAEHNIFFCLGDFST